MIARELMAVLAGVDGDAVIIPGSSSISHPRPSFGKARVSLAISKTKPPYGTRYLEMPQTGTVKVVVLE